MPGSVEELGPRRLDLLDALRESQIVIGLTQNSVTAPLKKLAPVMGFRGASMPSFNLDMIGSLRLDLAEVGRRCLAIHDLLARAEGADVEFSLSPGGSTLRLRLDLRHRLHTLKASGGLIREKGEVANLPGGETYLVPYEGERAGDTSRTSGFLPVQFGDEIVIYEIEGNRAISVIGGGPKARAEREKLQTEPAYGNLAEAGFGVLAEMGVPALPETPENLLQNEKRGFHVGFGRSDHFGGTVGPARFSRPAAAEHVDRVYTPETQPRVTVTLLTLTFTDGSRRVLIREGRYVPDVFAAAGP